MTSQIREILSPATASAFPALSQLRPTLVGTADFVRIVDEVQRLEGYRLVGVFERGQPSAPAVAGFRVRHSLSAGRFLYVDDLSTIASARRQGYARRLLDWLLDEARQLECAQVHLDSGVGLDRADAHRLYLNTGMTITAHHFAVPLRLAT
ncbi:MULTISPECIES: N-acetyltransferase [unclassified Parafrankia]|uniref:GNAT family N-acetyltransferase n=1 Tax=unclassified Parafrankia TaxID=2994368 RepID=UPI000DA4964B|nr:MULTISPECIES: GNAT family N-acetyltransferase [unclassified Parafrankia]TCJ33127.1 N-acetyltransferase [Parafrankia sp. BMG5.11]SQD93625.1 GCN5-related N-acetyltransferase [Parafrankia sp. Ea1.12]